MGKLMDSLNNAKGVTENMIRQIEQEEVMAQEAESDVDMEFLQRIKPFAMNIRSNIDQAIKQAKVETQRRS